VLVLELELAPLLSPRAGERFEVGAAAAAGAAGAGFAAGAGAEAEGLGVPAFGLIPREGKRK